MLLLQLDHKSLDLSTVFVIKLVGSGVLSPFERLDYILFIVAKPIQIGNCLLDLFRILDVAN